MYPIKGISIFTWIYENHGYIQGYIHARYIQFKFDISEIYHFRCIHHVYKQSGYICNGYENTKGILNLIHCIRLQDCCRRYISFLIFFTTVRQKRNVSINFRNIYTDTKNVYSRGKDISQTSLRH